MSWIDSPTFKNVGNDIDNSMEIREYYNLNQELKDAFSVSEKNTVIDGFRCQNEQCDNKEAVYGTTYLPYCDKNIECLKKNVEYLLLENTKLKR